MSGYTTTPNLALKKPISGADDDLWGTHWNQNADTLDTLTTKSYVDTQDALKAPLASPTLTGNPTAPTPTAGDNDTSIATTAFVTTAVGSVTGGAVIAATAPTFAAGKLWWDSTGGQLYVGYDDSTSQQYVPATNAIAGSTSGVGVFNVRDYGAVGNGTTDDYAAFNAALTALYAAKGGILQVPFSQAGYKLGTALVIDPGQYSGGGAITVRLNGNKLLPTHTGWCIDIKTNYFGVNNGAILGAKQVTIEGGGAVITGTATAAGALRMGDTVGTVWRDITVNGYTAGSAFQLFISTNDLSTWVEHSELVNLRGSGNLNGIYLKISGNNTSSFLGNTFRNCVFEAKVNNGKLFNIEGLLFDCLFEQCGGYYNQAGTTGGNGFYLNGGFTGTTFINPWIDLGGTGTQSALTDIVFGPNYTATPSYQPTILNPVEINLPAAWRTKLLVPGPIGYGTANTNVAGNPREMLRSPRTYYVATTGSDSTGDGLTSGTAFATVNQALAVIFATLDCAGQNVTIQLVDGTYTAQIAINGVPVGLGGASLIIAGNTSTPGNVVISTTNQDALALNSSARMTIQGLRLQTTTGGNGISLDGQSLLSIGAGCQFGVCATRHMIVSTRSIVFLTADYTITGNAPTHINVAASSAVMHNAGTINATGRTFSGNYLEVHENSIYVKNGGAYTTASTTGSRYWVYAGGMIQTYGGGATLLPGGTNGFADAASFGAYL